MDPNLYALEKHVDSLLREARATSVRAALVSSLRGVRHQPLVALAAAIGAWMNRRGVRRATVGAPGA